MPLPLSFSLCCHRLQCYCHYVSRVSRILSKVGALGIVEGITVVAINEFKVTVVIEVCRFLVVLDTAKMSKHAALLFVFVLFRFFFLGSFEICCFCETICAALI